MSFSHVNLSHANLSHANLNSDGLSDDNAASANFTDANLSSDTLIDNNFTRANFSDANLSGDSVLNARGVNRFTDATWTGATCPDGTKSNNDGGTSAEQRCVAITQGWLRRCQGRSVPEVV